MVYKSSTGGSSGGGVSSLDGLTGAVVLTSIGSTVAITTNSQNINLEVSAITLANDVSDTTTFPVFANTATGAQPLKTNASFTFDATTAQLGVSSLLLPSTASGVYQRGKLIYDSDNESLTFYNNDSAVALQIGQEEWIRVINKTGSTITNGAAVYLSGYDATSALQTIALAQANTGTTTVAAGLATESILNNAIGYVTVIGVVHGIDTSAFAAGNIVFVSSTVAGGLTATAPTAPNFRFRVGIVGNANAATGSIHVTPSTGALGNGTANQLFGMNTLGTAQEMKSLVAGSAGTEFVITTSINTITFNIPSASTTARGLVTTGIQTFAGTKNFSTATAAIFSGPLSGNASTATALATPRAINGVNFDGTAAITVPAAAASLTGTTIGSTIVSSSLTSVGVLTSGAAGSGFVVALGTATITGNLAANVGGTGQSSYTTGDLLYASTATVLSKLADVATGQVLVSGGVAAIPAWSPTPSVGSLTVTGTGVVQAGIFLASNNIPAIASNTLKACDFVSPASSVCWLRIQGATTGGNANLIAEGETNTGMGYFTQGTGAHSFFTNLTAQQFGITLTASAVNYPTVTGAVVGGNVVWGTVGTDTDIGITVSPKNSGLFSANRIVVTGTSALSNSMYLPAANTLGWAINGSGEARLDSGAFFTEVDDGSALGKAGASWSDLFLANGGVVNWNAGSATLTHSTSLLTSSVKIAAPSFAPNTTSGIIGTTTNDDAAAGSVGEVFSASVVSGSAVFMTTNVTVNVMNIPLTAGDWDVSGLVNFLSATTTSMTTLIGSITQTSGVTDSSGGYHRYSMQALAPGAGTFFSLPINTTRIKLAGTATIYLVAFGTFTLSTLQAWGNIYARRAR